MEADPSHITVVTNPAGHAALVDRDGQIVHGPVDPADNSAYTDMCAWLRGYLLDNHPRKWVKYFLRPDTRPPHPEGTGTMTETRQLLMAVRLPNGRITDSLPADPLAPQVAVDRLTNIIADLRDDVADLGVLPDTYQPEIVHRWEITTCTDWTPGAPEPDPNPLETTSTKPAIDGAR